MMDTNIGQFDIIGYIGRKTSVDNFREILRQERFRADRFNRKFSIIVFEMKNPGNNTMPTERFINRLSSSVRMIDETGWYAENRVGILLPDTSYEGAKACAERVTFCNSDYAPYTDYLIFSYPSNNILFSDTEPEKEDLHPRINEGYKIPLWKRGIDITVSAFGLILLSPLFLLVSLCIKMVSDGPVFFIQERVGYGGKLFKMYKFRTMAEGHDTSIHCDHMKRIINSENEEEMMFTVIEKKAIIPMGNFLRKSCIDELPQLINVFLGDMSLVGPRPCIPYEAKEYLQWHMRRFDITPGMTGLWQVSGKNNTTFREMIRLDIQYAMNRSLWLDLKILFKTPVTILLLNLKISPKHRQTIQSIEDKFVKAQ